MNILDIKMEENDADAETIRDYLKELLTQLWRKSETFSGKSPFGDSGWEYDLYKPIATNHLVDVDYFDENDDKDDWENIASFDEKKANKLIFDAIEQLN